MDRKLNKQNKIGIIVSSYRDGAPIGPMYTAQLYSKGLYASNKIVIDEILIICEYGSNIEKVKADFYFAKNITIVYAKNKNSILSRSILDSDIRNSINKIYSNCEIVVAIWYPALIANLNPSKLSRTIMIMMDSQVSLIYSTLNNFQWYFMVPNILRLLIYVMLEFYIGVFSYRVGFVSRFDKKLISKRNLNKVIYPKLPMDEKLINSALPNELPGKLLIPRPDIKLLRQFLQNIPIIDKSRIIVLLNDEIDEEISKKITHIKYIEKYENFFSDGGLVVLLDNGGSGVTNRVITISALGLPFVGTQSSTRGHDFKFPNCLLLTDDVVQLSVKSFQSINALIKFDDQKLKDYTKMHSYKFACLPIEEALSEYKI